ncbi:unnamed protein product [Prunus armeniaca]
MTHDDLFNINANIVKKLVEVVVDNCHKALIHIISNSIFSVSTLDVGRANTFVAQEKNLKPINVDFPRKSLINLTDEEVENLIVKIQNVGAEVVEENDGAGSATLFMGYATVRFIESSLWALDGDGYGDVYECSYVEFDLIELTFFA